MRRDGRKPSRAYMGPHKSGVWLGVGASDHAKSHKNT